MASIDLNELRGRFLDVCRNVRSLSDNTLCAYEQDLREFAAFHQSTCGAEVSGENIQDYVRFLREEKGHSPATVRRRIACLKSFLGWAKRDGFVPSCPFDDTPVVIRIPKRLPRALSRQQIETIVRAVMPSEDINLAAARDVSDTRRTTYLAICLMLATGMRVGELTAIRLADIDPECGAINVRGKGSRERAVFVTNRVLRLALRRYIEDLRRRQVPDDILLRNARLRPLTSQALRLRLRKLGDDLTRDQRITPHRFRHTAATILLEEGVDIRYVQRLLGHSSISTTEIYTSVADRSLRTALERADVIRHVI